MDIFEENSLYPNETERFLEHFGEYYDSVFVAFQPFFKIKDDLNGKISVRKSHQISVEELKSEDELFRNLPDFNAKIYSYKNAEYPEDEIIFEKAETVSWKDVRARANFNDYAEIYKALKTSIGAYREIFESPALCRRLSEFTEKESVYYPNEGTFDVLSKIEIFKALKDLGKNEIVVIDEFYNDKKALSLDSFDAKQFIEQIGCKDYYIYPADKSILFTIDWDSFFYLICSDKSTIEALLEKSNIEGFFCSEDTKHTWEWNEEGVSRLLEIEKQAKKATILDKVKNFFVKN